MSEVGERLGGAWQALHGWRGDPDWPAPRLVAVASEANRADQGNLIAAHEYLDEDAVLAAKMKLVAALIRESHALVAYTGAGLSKASGIPDYASKARDSVVRGPKLASSFDAQPTYAHHVLTALERAGYLKEYVQQNHDGLPQKAGFPQEKLNEIHGAWYDPSNPVVPFSGSLRHDLFEWLLEIERRADLCLCLGTSLSGMNADRVAVAPAERSREDPPRALGTVIVNLQRTRLDGLCAVRVWARLDDAFRALADELGLDATPRSAILAPGDVFSVPYDAEGRRDPGSVLSWDLRVGQRLRVAPPDAANAGVEGEVLGKDREGNYVIALDRRRRLGRWWVESALRGALERLPVVNVDAVVRTPAPEPVVEAGDEEDDGFREVEVAATSERAGGAPPEAPEALTVVQSHRRVEPAAGSENAHRWRLRLADGSEQWVAQVTWVLHPTFRQREVVCREPPFAVERIGWGTFDVGVRIQLRPELGRGPVEASHELTFATEGEWVATTRVPLG